MAERVVGWKTMREAEKLWGPKDTQGLGRCHLCGVSGVGCFLEFQGAWADLLVWQMAIISAFHKGSLQRKKRTTLMLVELRVLSCLSKTFNHSQGPSPLQGARERSLISCLIGNMENLGIVQDLIKLRKICFLG